MRGTFAGRQATLAADHPATNAGHGREVVAVSGCASRRDRSSVGSVTAETALVLPVLVAFVVGLVWLVSLGVSQARCVDAAREAARAVARDDHQRVAIELARKAAPEGARITIAEGGDLVEVTVSVDAKPPGPIFGMLPAVHLQATAVSAEEERDA